MAVSTIVPDLNDDAKVHIADVTGVSPGDTMIVENLDGGEKACGLVMPDGGVRASVAADEGDPIAIRFYRGAELVAQVTRMSPRASTCSTDTSTGAGGACTWTWNTCPREPTRGTRRPIRHPPRRFASA
jgi:hypothetical protein